MKTTHLHLSQFFVVGISYKKSDAGIRGQFAVSPQQLEAAAAKQHPGVENFFILSTCNRTEIYGIAHDAGALRSLLLYATGGDGSAFSALCYVKQGRSAAEHLFSVGAGLDSQILGDYEIVGQIKQAAKSAKELRVLGTVLERLVNDVLQCCKKIRTNTGLSSGTVSVSFAAVQYIRDHYAELRGKRILLVGTGKFGSNTCKNITDYLPGTTLTLVNRTPEKAADLAKRYSVKHDVIENLPALVYASDVIIVATSCPTPVIVGSHFSTGNKLVIDLSVPCNVDPAVRDIEGITLVNVDELGRIKDETLQRRAMEIPKVNSIIHTHLEAFEEWIQMRSNAPVLKEMRHKLLSLHTGLIFDEGGRVSCGTSTEQRIQKVINGLAVKMKTRNEKGCTCIEAINDFISPASV